MIYELAIHPDAEWEWSRLDDAIKRRFKQKLQKERLKNSRVAKDALHGVPDTHKIKIKIATPQFRLAYHVNDETHCMTILAVSSRDAVYDLLKLRIALPAQCDSDSPAITARASARYSGTDNSFLSRVNQSGQPAQ